MAPVNKLSLKRRRCDQVNQAIQIIAAHGRRFLYSASKQTYASMEIDERGRVWYIDYSSHKHIYTHPTPWNKWQGFSSGGTLRNLVEEFRDYIRTGKPLDPYYLGLERLNGENIWGTPKTKCRRFAIRPAPCQFFAKCRRPHEQGTSSTLGSNTAHE